MSDDQEATGLATPVRYVKGVGEARAELLGRMDIRTVGDLLLTLPRRYEDRRTFVRMASLQPGRAVTVKGVVAAAGWVNPRYGKGYFEAMLDDGSAVVPCRWFGAHYLADQLHKGDALVVYGKVSTYRKKPVLQHPEFERLGAEGEATLHTDRVVPIYALTEDLSQRVLRRIQFSAVEAYAGFVEDMLPASLREKRDLLDAETAVRQAHFPETMQDAQRARLRLVYDEFFCLQLILAIRKLQSERVANGIVHRPEGKLRERLERGLPFKLTGAQRRVIGELRTDMAKPFPMHRLLQGDVGSGKTVVAACALVDAVECGSQVAIMSPTEVLAAQHHQTFRDLVGRAGVPVAFLTGDVKGRKREHLLRDIAGGAAPVVVGTHALIQQGVEFKKLGLAIIDEQHRFGVEQRALLYGKGVHPDVLVMTATPIPRTLAMTAYGDLDVSVIDELPSGRPEVVTRVIKRSQLAEAYGFIRKQVAKGRQAFIVYPLVDQSEALDLRSASEMHARLSEKEFAGVRVGLMHGQMTAEEKEKVMQAFRAGDVSVLVATTVVEVGIDIPNATVMLIEHAERFGLAQLHQLRGRVGRGTLKSFCILEGDPGTSDSWRRLKVMEETNDGFRIAEEDLAIRGMGNLLGREQSGLPMLKVGDPVADLKTMQWARDDAFSLAAEDPTLADPRYDVLKKRVKALYREAGALARIG